MDQPHYIGHRRRLKEKFRKSPSSLADYEIMEMILIYVIPRKDVKPLAKAIMDKAEGSLKNVFTVDLTSIAGIGPGVADLTRLMMEFYFRLDADKVLSKPGIEGPADIYEFLKYKISLSPNEMLVALLLDAKNRIIHYRILSEGIVNAAIIFPRTVAEEAIKYKAVSVVISHNHPSGDAEPSQSDIEMTESIAKALEVLDIKLRDHVIVSKNGYCSLKDLGLL